MKKRIISFMIAAMLIFSSSVAFAAQSYSVSLLSTEDSDLITLICQYKLNKLGWLNKKYINGNYGANTKKAVCKLQALADLPHTEALDETTVKFILNGDIVGVKDYYQIVTTKWRNSWVKRFKECDNLYIIDPKTGYRVNINCVGGVLHADMEPKNSLETINLWRLSGSGKWEHKAIPVLLFCGRYVYPASIDPYPHAPDSKQTQNNNFDGEFCLHTLGSKGHATNAESKKHQAAIKVAKKYLGK